jgi:hypothetical protein
MLFVLLALCVLATGMIGCEKEEQNPPTNILKLGDVASLNFKESVAFLSEEKDTTIVSFTKVHDLRGSDCLGSAFIEILMQQKNEINRILIEVIGCSEGLHGNPSANLTYTKRHLELFVYCIAIKSKPRLGTISRRLV